MSLNEKQEALCREHQFDFSGLSAVFFNCTLNPTGTFSHTEALLSVSQAIMDTNGVHTEMIRQVDYDLAPGVYPDMTEHGFDRDDWSGLCRKVPGADILVIATPIWLGEESSICRRILERLYSESGKFNHKGQYLYYGRAGGCVVTGNEDGAKHCAILRSCHGI
ncbi:flavodoxin family protein [Halopseudomonas sp.]|uniref:flavodoxin family protein n=1 Tax=Halopseudomonas sp. TaxID=2901191 RepID=UPI0035679B4B